MSKTKNKAMYDMVNAIREEKSKTYEVYNVETGNWHTSGTKEECERYIDGHAMQILLAIREYK